MEEIKSWKAERLRRKQILNERRLNQIIIKDIEESIKQHLRHIISGQSAQAIAEMTERIKKSEKPVIIAESEDYFEPLKRRLEKEDELKSNQS
jgi:predicted P-loop ATPase/GTPase